MFSEKFWPVIVKTLYSDVDSVEEISLSLKGEWFAISCFWVFVVEIAMKDLDLGDTYMVETTQMQLARGAVTCRLQFVAKTDFE